ncbi:MAG: BON domain-containing protein [Ferruginibacter sp.]
MKSNEELQKDVQDAIKWEPLLKAAEIGVTAKDGVVTLTGVVDHYSSKIEAENAAKNVAGVKAVAIEIEVNYGGCFKKNDTDISNEIMNAWNWNWKIPETRIKVLVENGYVTLEGEVLWDYERSAAEKSVENLTGVKGISNNITIISESKDAIEQSAIEFALDRSWPIYDHAVKVHVIGNKVTLTGIVHSLYQKDEAERLAWNASGVNSVDNELSIEFS